MEKDEVTEELAAEVKRYRENEGLDVRSISEIMEISMQDVTKIINSDVYKGAEVEPADQPKVTVEKGPPGSGFSEERLEEILDQVYEWGVEFSETEYFEKLTDEQKRHSEFIIQSFAQFMYSYYGLEPTEWHKKGPEGGLEECCTWVFPKKITAGESCFESIAPVLAAFFSFAGDRGLVKNPQSLVRRIRDIDEEIAEKASDPRNWGLAKSMMMPARDAGVDLEDEQELNDFLKSRGARPLERPEGRDKRWSEEEVRDLSTEQIVQKLQDFGVDFGEEQFLEDVHDFHSASELADHWREVYPVTATGFDEDFIWLAATVLWERLAPDVVSSEQLDDMMQKGYDLLYGPFMERKRAGLRDRKQIEACNLWLEVWEHLKERFTPNMESIRDAEQVFSGTQSLQNWCQDMEMELGNAGLEDPSFYEDRVSYCREFYNLFPESGDQILLNMKIAEAESLFALGELEQGEDAFKNIIEEYPEDPWGYVRWGDMYCITRPNDEIPLDYEKAEEIYRMAMTRNVEDDDVVLERLKKLEREKGER
ncbi:hypothetical protein AKJ61_02410 [candidate division MSBL1 archaeon SCGC-AAA259B11]|uniref:Uncharacterized protein n=1 Tax=candidate division MSBL1 archaeon SCGC-AAA259B11 TaxID=1698260 RepID=A0A133U661_9EURY|nr:hypothetical protein AKJ61_02410 [candidate division MSBL1 archaeon SCGC-AAA259B11]